MGHHELTVSELKCAVFDLLSTRVEELLLEEILLEFKVLFMEYFDIQYADVLLYDDNRYVPLFHNERNMSAETVKDEHPIFNVSLISNAGHEGYEYADDSLIIRDQELNPLGALLFQSTEKWHDFALSPHLKELKNMFGTFFSQLLKLYKLYDKEKTYRQLFEVTELFNSTLESAVILDGMVKAVSDSLPGYSVQLLLSQEQKGKAKDYRLFDYLNERASAVEAFLTGELTIEDAEDLSGSLMNAPIRGRQGIYGVLQIMASADTKFTGTEKNFIKLIAKAAGNALENASLYEQSHRLVADLQLVNEASRKLNSNLNIEEMLAFLSMQFQKAFRPDEMAFFFNKEVYNLSPSNTPFFQNAVGTEFADSVLNRFKAGEEAIFDANIEIVSNEELMFKSLVALPITNRGDMIGFIILLHQDEYFFSFDSFKLMRSLIGHSSLAISNIMLRDQLQELVDRDNLTKLYTRTYLDKKVANSLKNKEESIFLLLDVDNFKLVNDMYGHATGDEVLRQISAFILSKAMGVGIACRWGGEEIAVFLPSTTISRGMEFANMLVESIPGETDPRVTVSIGMSSWSPNDDISYMELFQLADKALYDAKNGGKNQYIVHGGSSATRHC